MLESSRANSARWYALYTRSRFEKKVRNQLSKKKIESYLPLIEEIRIWSDRKKRVEEPLFKGYVFIFIDLRHRQHVLETDGVVKFVGTRNGPTAIPDQEIEAIKTIFSDLRNMMGLQREKTPVVGEQVEITAGPLRGLKGIVLGMRSTTRLVIQVEVIAQAFSVEIRPDFIARPNLGAGIVSSTGEGCERLRGLTFQKMCHLFDFLMSVGLRKGLKERSYEKISHSRLRMFKPCITS